MNLIMTSILTLFLVSSPPDTLLDSGKEKEPIFKAVFYSDKFVGRKTKSSEIFSQNKLTCASNDYKIGDILEITNIKNGKSVIVKVNDSGAFKRGTLDLTKGAFSKLASLKSGRIKVKVRKINHGI